MTAIGRRCLTLSLAALAGSAAVVGARAQPTREEAEEAEALSALFGDRDAAQPPFVVYIIESTRQRISLDRSQPDRVLMNVEGEGEIWSLTSDYGARGDEVLRNDIGETVLRINAMGGATYYAAGDTVGLPAAVLGVGRPLLRPRPSGRNLQQVVEAALPGFERIVGPGQIRLEASGRLPPSLVEEALTITLRALDRMPRSEVSQGPRRLRRVRCDLATEVAARFLPAGSLQLRLIPGIGYSGRPSSLAILRALSGSPR